MHKDKPQLFIFGLGYVGSALAQHMHALGWRVIGTTRDAEKRAVLESQGIAVCEIGDETCNQAIEKADYIISTVPPRDGRDPALAYMQDVAGLSGKWLGYVSTTAVYGDHGGDWVDEKTPPTPNNERGEMRLAAEQGWAALNTPMAIFRISGIYGPGRNALRSLKLGKTRPIDKEGQFFSRIHRDDIISVLSTAITGNETGVYNLADDNPTSQAVPILYAAKLLGMPTPESVAFDSADLSPMMRSFFSANRRVKNNKIKEKLGIILKYPSYKDGLKAIAKLSNDTL